MNGSDLQQLTAAEKLTPPSAVRGHEERCEKFTRVPARIASFAMQVPELLHGFVHAAAVEQGAGAIDLRVPDHLVEIEHGKLEQVRRTVEDLHSMRRIPVREGDLFGVGEPGEIVAQSFLLAGPADVVRLDHAVGRDGNRRGRATAACERARTGDAERHCE